MASTRKPISSTCWSGWPPAARPTTACMSFWPGTGRPRARPKDSPPRHDAVEAEATAGNARSAKADQDDDGGLRHVVRAARTMDERARQVADASAPAGDVALHARR